MTNPDYQTDFFPGDYDQYTTARAGDSVQSLREHIKKREERIVLLKEIKKDGDARLEAQEREIDEREQEIKEKEEEFRRELRSNDEALSEAGKRLHHTDRTIISLNEKHCRGLSALQRTQHNKHQWMTQAKREVREEMRLEREQRAAQEKQLAAMTKRRQERGQRQALDQQQKNAAGRRAPSMPGSFFSRVSTGGGSGVSPANGSRAGK